MFSGDLLAGISVGIISLPLTMAFAIASGLTPERGLFTGIVAGFLISLLGGSRVQIGGPTGAFVVIVYSVVQRHGYDGLALATLLAGAMMVFLALVRAGVLLKFIPYSVTIGFTAGIALTIFSSQVKDLFGLSIDQVPADFVEKWASYIQHAWTWNPWALMIGIVCTASIFFLRAYYPKVPGPIIAVLLSTIAVAVFQIPVETIETKFGEIPRLLPAPSLPSFSLEKLQAVFPDAITIALLGAIESLLSAVVADGMTGHRHRSNTELFAQGLANIGSIIFGGIPATGAIARTSANIKLGAKTPLAGMLHAVTLLMLMVFFAPYAAKIPLPTLAGVLIFIAWNMSEIENIGAIFRGPKSDILVLIATFSLTVLIDLTVALQAGVLLAAILFLKNVSNSTSVKACQILIAEEEKPTAQDSELLFRKDIPEQVSVFEVDGPLFFGSAYALNEQLYQLHPHPQVFILRLHKVPLIDATGIYAIKDCAKKCRQQGIQFYLSGVSGEKRTMLKKAGVEEIVGNQCIFTHFEVALNQAKAHLPNLVASAPTQLAHS